jgi:alpha-tubulin suppressor-like RCC1 family protein
LSLGVTAVVAGGAHTCALLQGGRAMCWGSNQRGQIGDGSATPRWPAPVDVSGLGAGVASIYPASDSGRHTFAVLQAGGLKCWGDNLYGQLGDGTLQSRRTPVDVLP